MSDRRRWVGALVVALIAVGLTGCAIEPPPSCGEYTLDKGESIPQEAVDCMSEAGEDGAVRVITGPHTEGYFIATTYSRRSDGGIFVTAQYMKNGGARFMKVCPDAVSLVHLGECEELHEGD